MSENGSPARGYLLFAWSPDGYALVERDGDVPRVGAEVQDDGYVLSVVKVGPSPLPGDTRRCAYTVGSK